MSVEVQLPDAPKTTAVSVTALPSIPPLENGDYLTRDEFERRFNAMPRVKVAELIEGRVFVPLPVHSRYHGEPHASITGWLGFYTAYTPNIGVYNNTTLRLDETNEPQPDVLLRIDETAGGQTTTSPDDILEGAPELIAEVAGSSASHDLRDKLTVYRRNGVREYIVWSIHEQQLSWFRLEAGEYVPSHPDSDGVIRSRVFPGLWLDVAALLKDDMAEVLAILQQGLASSEHSDFVKRLSEAKQ
jgi:Uma2 family endonuclease